MTVETRTYWDRFRCFFTQSDLDAQHREGVESIDRLIEHARAHGRPRSYESKVAGAKADALRILKP